MVHTFVKLGPNAPVAFGSSNNMFLESAALTKNASAPAGADWNVVDAR